MQNLFECGLIYAPAEATGNGDYLFKDWADKVITECADLPKGAHDDLADAMTQALKHLRELGLAQLPDEDELDREDENSTGAIPRRFIPVGAAALLRFPCRRSGTARRRR